MNVFLDDLCPVNVVQGGCPSLKSLVTVLGRIPAVLWATDLEARFTSLTGAGLQSAGISPLDFAGKSIEALFPCSEHNDKPRLAHRLSLIHI